MKKSLIIFWLIFFSAALLAEEKQVYVTDILQLKLRTQADNTAESIKTIRSGAALTWLEGGNQWARVRTEDGLEGWVQAWFLVDQQPARALVEGLEKQNEQLKTALDKANHRLENSDNDLLKENKTLQTQLAASKKETRNIAEQMTSVTNQLQKKTKQLKAYQTTEAIDMRMVAAGALVLAFLAGWAVAYWRHAARERKRLSGYRLAP